jgi:hypothetical protein
MIKFVSDLRQMGVFCFTCTPVSSINKSDRHDMAEIVLKVTLNTIAIIICISIETLPILRMIPTGNNSQYKSTHPFKKKKDTIVLSTLFFFKFSYFWMVTLSC